MTIPAKGTAYDRQEFVVMAGMPTADGVTLQVLSESSANMTITGSGISETISSWTTVGDDVPASGKTEACFQASVTLTGLSAFTQYSYTAVQSGVTQTQKFYTAPAASDKFLTYVGTCDRAANATNNIWQYIYETANNSSKDPVVAITWNDDIGYIDGRSVDDSADTGHVFSVPLSNEYEAAVAYMSFFGMLGDSTQGTIAGGLNFYRHWCLTNINWMPMWGNHEFGSGGGNNDDFGTKDAVVGTSGNSFNSSLNDGLGYCKVVYEQMLEPLQGTSSQSADTAAKHWEADLGSLIVVSADPITNYTGPAGSVQFGANQISDIKTALNTTHPFKIFSVNKTGRDAATDALRTTHGKLIDDGWIGKYSLEEMKLTEYKSLFRDDTGASNSIMENDNTNGVDGVCVMVNGDMHLGLAAYYHAASGSGVLEEDYYWINARSIASTSRQDGFLNSAVSQGNTTELIPEGYDDNDVLVDYLQDYLNDGVSNSFVVEALVDGSLSNPVMTMKVIEQTSTEWIARWAREFSSITGNRGVVLNSITHTPQTSGTIGILNL